LIVGTAMRAKAAYIYVRGEFWYERLCLERAIEEAYAKGFVGKNACGSGIDFDVYAHSGAGGFYYFFNLRCLHLWRRKCTDPVSRRQNRETQIETALPGKCRSVWMSYNCDQCGDSGSVSNHHAKVE
jgi:hypothetical protein